MVSGHAGVEGEEPTMKDLSLSVVRLTGVFLVGWGIVAVLGLVLHLGTAWPGWVVALPAAVAAEAIILLYRYEQRAVGVQKGRWLTGLRLAALGVMVWMLLEPVFSRRVERELEREVVIVMDDSASMHLVDEGSDRSRFAQAEAAVKESGLAKKLEGAVRVRTLRAARRALAEGDEEAEGWDQATDLANALETVLEQTPPDNLGGVVMLTDGRHNRPARVEDVARRFGIMDAPVGLVAVGSGKPPRDAAILEVRSPDSIYLGDRIRVAARIKVDGYRGQEVTLRLRRGEEVLEAKKVRITGERHREEVRFQHVPEAGGVGQYTLELVPKRGETFENNNTWGFETAVTDARTNVLVVDSFPRWEFRYLRNLFYGRDKSIHLQYVLLNPDTVRGQRDEALPASAARRFGEARATRLPENEDEWRKFDVIIVGDVPEEALGNTTWEILERCVSERAALLVAVAGPRSMPHAYRSEVARSLFPVECSPRAGTHFEEETPPFRLTLTAAGRNHPVTAQSDSRLENDRIWAGFPKIRWRHPVDGVKEGAEILVVAGSPEEERRVTSAAELGDALVRLARRRERQEKQAVLVTQQVGHGKVAMLLTDRTWRLREGVGDVFHHRFWGQLVRWGAGPNLRSGTALVRLGSDALSYTGDDRLQITARLWDPDKTPVEDSSLRAEVWRDGGKLVTVPLAYRDGSNGLHEAAAGPFRAPGRYEISLVGDEARRLMKESGVEKVATGFRVVGARNPVELSETTLNRPLLATIAELSGGRVVDPPETGALAGLFFSGEETREELLETRLWDNWALLLLFCGLLASEWVIRRGSGLP